MTDLAPAVSGEDVVIDRRAGPITIRVAGAGRPLVLLHSLNAAASGAEVAPVHEWAQRRCRVFTPDLPGFGRSDRSDRDYSIRLYTDAVHDVVDAVIEADPAAPPPIVLGTSLSCEFVARAALEAPEHFSALALTTPTGFDRRSRRWRGPKESSREIGWLYRLLSGPAGRVIYPQLTRPAVIRYFLKRTFGRDDVDERLWRYCCEAVRVPGARHAPIAFLSGRLFAADIRDVYEALELPVWLGHGTRGDFADFSGSGWAERRANWHVLAYDGGALPWFDVPEEFLADLAAFFEEIDGPTFE